MPSLVVYTTGPDEQALALLRYGAPAEALGWQIIPGKEGKNSIFPERVHQADFVLVQRDFPRFFREYRNVVAEARLAGKPIIYDLDDLLLAIPSGHPNFRDYQDALGGMAFALMDSDRVVVSTPLLRDVLVAIQPQISVWPTVIPDQLWPIRQVRDIATDKPLTLGYMGGTSHAPDLQSLTPVLLRILEARGDQVQIHFWGCPPPHELVGIPQVRQVHSGISDYALFADQFSATAHADLWLAPLKDDLFNRCKSSIKFWEYSAVGGVGVYSRLEPYESVVRNGENGLLADSADEWFAAIDRLASDPELRMRLARNAQETLLSSGMLSKHLSKWKEIFSDVTSRRDQSNSPALITSALLRFSEAVQQRADERRPPFKELLEHAAPGILPEAVRSLASRAIRKLRPSTAP